MIATSALILAYFVANRSSIVGQITEVTGTRWGTSSTSVGVGTLLEQGQQLDLRKAAPLLHLPVAQSFSSKGRLR